MNLLHGSCGKGLVRFSIPIILSLLVQQLYQLCDTLLVGRLLGDGMVTAVGNAGTVIGILTIICGGFELGGQLIFSEAMGRGDYGFVRRGIPAVLRAAVAAAVVVALGAICLQTSIFHAMHLPENLFHDTQQYFTVYVAGLPLQFVQAICMAGLLALGDSKSVLPLSALSCGLNIVLDGILLRFTTLGVMGAALATVIAQLAGMTGSGVVLWRRLRKLPTAENSAAGAVLGRLLKVSVPSMLQQLALTFGGTLLQALVNTFPEEVSSGYVVALRLSSFLMLPVIGLAQSLSMFTAANRGAGEFHRIQLAKRWAYAMALGYLLLFGTALAVAAQPVSSPFLTRTDFVVRYLRCSLPAFLFTGIQYTSESLLRGFGRMRLFLLTTLLSLTVQVGAAYLLASAAGSDAFWLGNTAARLAAAVAATLLAKKCE